MDQGVRESWKFSVTCPHADRVYLVKVINGSSKTWLPMIPVGYDVWELGLGLSPGHYQFSYFTAEGETFFNGGSYGLTVSQPGNADPRVTVEPMEQPLAV